MPPGASLLMRGLGMREIDRYVKDRKPSRADTGSHNRPVFFSHIDDGDCWPDFDTTLGTNKYLDHSRRNSEGLSENYVQRLFEYERSKWRPLGFISPYKDVRGRAARDKREFRLWLHWHPNRKGVRAKMEEQYGEGYSTPYGYIHDEGQMHGLFPGRNGHNFRRQDQEPYRRHGGPISYDRPPYRQHGLVDYRDPRYCPPYPAYYYRNRAQRGTHHPAHGTYEARDDRRARRSRAGGRPQGHRDTGRSPHPVFGSRRNGAQQGRFRPPMGDYHVQGPRRRDPRINDEYDRNDDRTAFIRRDRRHHMRHPSREESEDDDEDFTSSQQSNRSYVRSQSAHIIYPPAGHYHGRPLHRGRRNAPYGDDSDDEDEPFRRRGGYIGRRRDAFGIRRSGGRRGFDPEHSDYDFSGDEDDDFLF